MGTQQNTTDFLMDKTRKKVLEKARNVRYLLLDVDGVMTNGFLFFDEEGREIKAFSIYDGLGITLLHKYHVGVGIISGRTSVNVIKRAKDLKIRDLYQGIGDKIVAYEEILNKYQLVDEDIAFIGDDLIDLPVLRRVGFSVAVANAVDRVKKEVDWVTKRSGGEGAVREVIDLILSSQGIEAYA
ncbi:MAG: KdsC family phosphatase [Nitrospiria bacterium]